MSATSKPVWVWLPSESEPVRCGTFTLVDAVGTFEYDEAYRQRAGAVSLDPLHLRMDRSRRPYKEIRQGGLFGVFRDASPEGFGLALLERLRGATLTDPLTRLELSEGDSVGAIEVCDDIASKMSYAPPAAQELFDVLRRLPAERPSSQAAREVKGVVGTSLGGERPKLTVLHKGQQWIAKLQDRGDAPHAPLREYVAMRIAASLELDVAEVEFFRIGDREVLLVRRFDREVDAAGRVLRKLYASAHTVLRLDMQTRGEKVRSYVALAYEIKRWCADKATDPLPLQRELWARMAYNAVCGNGDDHPRNHGLMLRGGHWTLAPAFDIAPYLTFSETLSMAVNRKGVSTARAVNLLEDCASFEWDRQEAGDWLKHARDVFLASWPQEVQAQGFVPADLPVRDPAAWLDKS